MNQTAAFKSLVHVKVPDSTCGFCLLQDPAGIFELVEVVGNGTYGQVYKVRPDAPPTTLTL